MTTHLTGFLPTRHGFPFPNCFPSGAPVVEIPTPFGRIPIGDAGGGLCGGMVFAALDLYLLGVRPPRKPTAPVYRYLCRRLLDSWNLPFGVLKYYDWQCRPDGCRTVAGVRAADGVARLTAEIEWPKVREGLDAGLPVPLGVVIPSSFDPRQLPRNHQVLAYGYDLDESAGELALRVYDPNYPNDDEVALRLCLTGGGGVCHSCEGATVRGFFRTEYIRPLDPPVLGG